MAVPCSGINEQLPLACAWVSEHALLYDGTEQGQVFGERPARAICGVIVLQKPPDPLVVCVRTCLSNTSSGSLSKPTIKPAIITDFATLMGIS
jgi:hypothetical protein